MSTGISLRQRPSTGISGAATRRLQASLWLLVLALAIGMIARTGPKQLDILIDLRNLTPVEAAEMRVNLADLGLTSTTLANVTVAGYFIQWIALVVISAMLLWKRKGTDWFGFSVALTMIAGIGAIYPPSLSDMVDGQVFWLVVGKLLTGIWVSSLFLLPLLFPTGGFVPRWMIVPALVLMTQVIAFVIWPGNDPGDGLSAMVEVAIDIAILVSILGSLVYRYWWRSTLVQRQQMKWGTIGAAITLPTFIAADAAMRSIDGSFRGFLALLTFTALAPVFSLMFPLCLTIAILRYRLWDIDVYLSRTLIWLLMTALVVAAYMGIVFGIGSRFEGDQTTVLSLVALGLTAVLFQPVRERVQHGIDRLLFGDRHDPYRVVRKLADDLSETIQPAEALRATVRTLTEALRLPYAAITLESGAAPVAAAGVPGTSQIPIPLTYQSQSVGELIVSPRGGAREFDAADLRLLADLSHQIGVVAHNVRLTQDLQLSRERIVTAREEERRRLRRDLHDGLGAQLAALSMQASAMKATIPVGPDAAVAQATELQQELRNAIADIRRLVQGLRPAALDDLGLIGALRNRINTVNLGEPAHGQHRPLLITLDAQDELGDLPAAVEVAIYRIVDEALTNTVRHAHAGRCTVCLSRTIHGVRLTIEDDGIGIAPDRISGVGLQSMRERALELGGSFVVEPGGAGGTRIAVELPATGGSDRTESTRAHGAAPHDRA